MTRPDNALVERLVVSLDNATVESQKLNKRMDEITAEGRRRATRFWAALAVMVLVIGVLSFVAVRQNCLNDANDARQKSAQNFYEREVTKLYKQADGFQKLRDAATDTSLTPAEVQAQTLVGFDEFLKATKDAANGNTDVLKGLGYIVHPGKDGQVVFKKVGSGKGGC